MSYSPHLESLSLAELTILFGHLRLGESHLRRQLNQEQYKQLLHFGSLDTEQKMNVSSTAAEKSGKVATLLNTVITSVFGAWMGFSGFAGWPLNSATTLICITLFALIISLIVGYFSFKLTALTAQAAIKQQKIHNVKFHVLTLMIAKRNNSLDSIINHLNYSLWYVQTKSSHQVVKTTHKNKILYEFEKPGDFSRWLAHLSQALHQKIKQLRKNIIYKFYGEDLLKIIAKLENKITNLSVENMFHLPHENNPIAGKESLSFIRVLTAPLKEEKVRPLGKAWFKENKLTLLTGSIPTLLGGFASMFVFLEGAPNLAKELAWLNVEQMLRNPGARIIELSLAVTLTLYYGISFVYNNYKSYIRELEMSKTMQELTLLEEQYNHLDRKYHFLVKLKSETKRIINIYMAIENIESFSQTAEISYND